MLRRDEVDPPHNASQDNEEGCFSDVGTLTEATTPTKNVAEIPKLGESSKTEIIVSAYWSRSVSGPLPQRVGLPSTYQRSGRKANGFLKKIRIGQEDYKLPTGIVLDPCELPRCYQ